MPGFFAIILFFNSHILSYISLLLFSNYCKASTHGYSPNESTTALLYGPISTRKHSSLCDADIAEPTAAAIPTANMNYKTSGRLKSLSATNLDHLHQICSNFIPENGHLSSI